MRTVSPIVVRTSAAEPRLRAILRFPPDALSCIGSFHLPDDASLALALAMLQILVTAGVPSEVARGCGVNPWRRPFGSCGAGKWVSNFWLRRNRPAASLAATTLERALLARSR